MNETTTDDSPPPQVGASTTPAPAPAPGAGPSAGVDQRPNAGGGDDPVWERLRDEAAAAAEAEPALEGLFRTCLLERASLEDALSVRLARKLGNHAVPVEQVREVFMDAFEADPGIGVQVRRDIVAVKERDPACAGYLCPVLYFKGFQALVSYRVAHRLWKDGRHHLAHYLQSLVAEEFAVDIHPAARIGSGILLDHATSIVVGETAVIDDDVSILHEVTLGGTGKQHGDRHPKIRSGVLIGAGAKLLGNIEVGAGAKVAAGSVVLKSVPPHKTVAGVPAVVVGEAREANPALAMDQDLD